jgi:hypothetical protein
MKLTRRELVATAVAPALAAQTPPVPSDSAQDARTALSSVRRNGEALSRFAVPVETEPAFQFKA